MDLASMHLHGPRPILKDVLVLFLKPSNGLVDHLRGLLGQLAVIHMETDSHLVPFDGLVRNSSIIWVELVFMLGKTLDELLVVE
jgi:hypothetical protein